MPVKLTAASVAKLKPTKVRREIPDAGCPGLFLIIQPTGRRSWALRFRLPSGRHAKLTLGPVDLTGKETESQPAIGTPLTVAGAHLLATEVKRQRAMGRDVVASRHREKLERAAAAKNTFAAAAIDFIEQHARKRNRTWKEQARQLGLTLRSDGKGWDLTSKGLAHRWRDRPISAIDGDDIHTIVEEARRKGIPGTVRRSHGATESLAKAMFAVLSAMFGWLVQRRRVKLNPCLGAHRPKAPKARARVLTDAEIAFLWGACEAESGPFGAVLKLLLLTGCRLSEITEMRRAELVDDGSNLNLPGARTKNGLPHIVPLSPLARSILSSIKAAGEFVFSTGDGKVPVYCGSKVKQRIDATMVARAKGLIDGGDAAKVEIEPWRFHDLRRTCATGMAEIGIAPHIVEACLNHISGAKAGVAGVYNRAAYAPEKKEAYERWAAHIQALVTAGKKTESIDA